MSTLLKKFVFSFLSFLVVFFSFAPNFIPIKAADTPTWYSQSISDWYSKVYDENTSPSNEIFGERYTAAQVQWVMYSVPSVILNMFVDPKITSCFITNTKDISSCVSLINGLVSTKELPPLADTKFSNPNLISLVFADRPISGVAYIRQKSRDFTLVPVAHAQATPGFGFSALQVVQDIWKASRDIAFALFVLAAVVFAFMIMFRVKISPQVVITVQSAIPKLIISLILVTFSYAIAGFLIDLMYVVYGILSVFGASFLPALNLSPAAVFEFFTGGRIGYGAIGVDLGIFGLLALYLLLLPFALVMILFATLGVLQSLILGVAGAFLGGALGPVLLIVGILLLIIAIIVIMWHGVKTVISLLKAYVNILLLTMFAPLQIVAGLIIPNFGFGNWLKSYISNLAVFIVTSLLVFFSFVFMLLGVNAGFESIAGAGTSFPAFLAKMLFGSNFVGVIQNIGKPSSWPPLLGAVGSSGGAQNVTGLLLLGVSFVLFTLIPKAAEIVQGLLSGKPFAYGSAVGEAFGGVGWAYGASGTKETYEMAKKALRQGQLDEFFNKYDENTGRLASAIKRLENMPGIGQQVTNVRDRIQQGLKH